MNRIFSTAGLFLFALPLSAQQIQYGGSTEILGSQPGGAERAHFGERVVVIGDVNGDSIPDYAVATRPTGSLLPTDVDMVELFSGLDSSLLFRWEEASGIDIFGASIAAAGDVNADGVPDIIIGSRLNAVGGAPFLGSAYVFSGADGSELYRFDGNEENASFGVEVSGAGDYNNDGYDDVMVSAPNQDMFSGAHPNVGYVYVYSGFDGSRLNTFRGDAEDYLGSKIAGAGDLNGDGFDDILLAASGFSIPGSYGDGAVFAYSGADRSLLHIFFGDANEDYFGHALASIADLNGDGTPDVLIASEINDDAKVRVYSGATGERLFTIQQVHEGTRFGFALADAGDVDGDGIHDILIGAPFHSPPGEPEAGAAYVFSGADGHRILDIVGAVDHMELGSAVSALGDIHGDGKVEFLVAARNADSANGLRSGLVKFASFSPFLNADSTTLSLSGSSALTLDLAFPISEAGMEYQVLASLHGTTPGLVDSIGVPLTQDSLFQRLQLGAAPTGILNAQGSASQSLVSPRFAPGLVGKQLSIATISRDPITGTARISSVSRTVTLVP